MVKRKLHKGEPVWFIHSEYGVTGAVVKGVQDSGYELEFKCGIRIRVIVPAEEIYLSYDAVTTEFQSSKYQNIPEKYAAEYDKVVDNVGLIDFLYNHLEAEAKPVAEKLIYQILGIEMTEV